jgi:hypothetical protein
VEVFEPFKQEIVEVFEPFKRLVVAAYNNQHWTPASSTSAVRQRFRREAFSAYGAMNEEDTENWCVVTGMWWPARAATSVPYVRNAHIMGRSTPESDWVSAASVKCHLCSACAHGASSCQEVAANYV